MFAESYDFVDGYKHQENRLRTADHGDVVAKIPLLATILAHHKASYHESHSKPGKDVHDDDRLEGIR